MIVEPDLVTVKVCFVYPVYWLDGHVKICSVLVPKDILLYDSDEGVDLASIQFIKVLYAEDVMRYLYVHEPADTLPDVSAIVILIKQNTGSL